MSKVMTGASMSLDGYVAAPADPDFAHLFRWYGDGDVAVQTADESMTIHSSAASAELLRTIFATTGAVVCGRGVFDITNGWDGNHPIGCPVVCMTHNPPADWPYDNAHFVTDGIEAAVELAKNLAGDRTVAIAAGTIASQALNAGLVDEVCIDLIPVLLGEGTSYFDALADVPVPLENPTVIEGTGVTHLRYRVVRAGAAT